jgi:hypothetical protein
MLSIKHLLKTRRERRRVARATLPWAELEAEAARQGCSPADVFFDRAARPMTGLPATGIAVAAREPKPGGRQARKSKSSRV